MRFVVRTVTGLERSAHWMTPWLLSLLRLHLILVLLLLFLLLLLLLLLLMMRMIGEGAVIFHTLTLLCQEGAAVWECLMRGDDERRGRVQCSSIGCSRYGIV